jgi:hypothetical protein
MNAYSQPHLLLYLRTSPAYTPTLSQILQNLLPAFLSPMKILRMPCFPFLITSPLAPMDTMPYSSNKVGVS